MPLYVFEWGRYPAVSKEEEVELRDDAEAREYAVALDVDYVWDVPEDSNPRSVYSKPK